MRQKMPRHKTALSRVLVTLSTIVVGLVLLLPSTGKAESDFSGAATVTVRPGDTLWSIAEDVAEPGQDIRDTVAVLREINDLDSSVIVPDQSLVVPDDGPSESRA